MDSQNPRSIDKYEIVSVLGRGATSVVYLAYDAFTERRVALKLFNSAVVADPDNGGTYRKLIAREASLAGHLEHPNIVGIYDAALREDASYLVMEYVEGETLEKYCKPDHLLPTEKVVEVIFKCALALDYANRNGVIHRDIKPANLMLCKDGGVKITDFGAAINFRCDETQVVGLGSPAYMSPEQMRFDQLTHQTDIYSVGVLMFVLLTGRAPFQAENYYGLTYKIMNEDAPGLRSIRPDLAVSLETIISRAMRKRLDERYGEWSDFAKDMAQATSLNLPEDTSLAMADTQSFGSMEVDKGGSARRFLLVDDDHFTLKLIQAVLENAGHSVWVFESSVRALREIPVVRPDCVILDVIMPEMDGFELCREIRRRPDLAAIKIIMCSSKPYDFDRRRAKELGANGYIVKPINPESLLRSIMEILSDQVTVNYWGVRGTLPVPGPGALRHGGNTSCVSIEVSGEPLYVFDCGSGIKRLSDHLAKAQVQRLSARIFVSHTHWDHINTIPFFGPLYVRGNQIEVFGPYQGDLTIERAIAAQMESVYFPVTVREFGARIMFRDLREESIDFGAVKIDTILLKHPGYCLGYRFTSHGRSVCYITDNELYLPNDPRYDLPYVERLANFVRGTDLLITDTTYRDHEYPSKVDWGHSAGSEVAKLAARAEVKHLHLFHHDPDQSDDDIDRKLDEVREAIAQLGSAVECDAPSEGSVVVLQGSC